MDGYKNFSLSDSLTVRADTKPPAAVTGFNAVYDNAAQAVTVTWNDPAAADLQELRLSWTGTGDGTTAN